MMTAAFAGETTASTQYDQQSSTVTTDSPLPSQMQQLADEFGASQRSTADVQGSSASTSTPSGVNAPTGTVQPPAHVVGMQKWEGRILALEEGFLTAEVEPIDHDGPIVQADFSLDLLVPDDVDARVGDVVYLTVRTVAGPRNHRTVTSTLRLQRLGNWTDGELESMAEKARVRHEEFLRYVD